MKARSESEWPGLNRLPSKCHSTCLRKILLVRCSVLWRLYSDLELSLCLPYSGERAQQIIHEGLVACRIRLPIHRIKRDDPSILVL